MGIRNREIVDYYIPLFSGVDAARRARWRLRIPFDNYAPYIPGIGGDYEDPIDPTLVTPVITYPTLGDNTDLTLCAIATSSEFEATNDQTHTASRWIVELISMTGELTTEGAGSVIADTGRTPLSLTALNFNGLGLASGASYRIKVRYEGSDGGWSDWSLPVPFVMADCNECVEEEPPPSEFEPCDAGTGPGSGRIEWSIPPATYGNPTYVAAVENSGPGAKFCGIYSGDPALGNFTAWRQDPYYVITAPPCWYALPVVVQRACVPVP
jgi:hypothetical protein